MRNLAQRMALPLEAKINMTKARIWSWHDHFGGQVYVSFSGGKDRTVLLHLARSIYPDIAAAFCNTGLEYPEIVDFVKQTDNVAWIKPSLSFKQVIDKYGYPVISKEQAQYIHELRTTKSQKLRDIRTHGNKWGQGKVRKKWLFMLDAPFNISNKCCDYLKKQPFSRYEKDSGLRPMLGNTVGESKHRQLLYIKHGCNNFGAARPVSKPMSFWTDDDIWAYIRLYDVACSRIYDYGYKRTGCMFCMFGVHLEQSPNKFQLMHKTHPKQFAYCVNKLQLGKVLDYIGVNYYPDLMLF